MNKHYFSIEIAKEVGVNAAVVFQNLHFWIQHNEEKQINYHDGKYWTYNSVETMKTVLPYMTANQIRLALQKLKEAELIETGNYNKMKYDKTAWYSVGEKAKILLEKDNSISEKSQTESTKNNLAIGNFQKPIPDINPRYKNKNINPDRIAEIRKLCGIS